MNEVPEMPVNDPRNGVTSTDAADEGGGDVAYAKTPVELKEGVLGCEFCGYNRFRRSRVRMSDVFEVLRLRYPMRCMRCGQRQYQDVALAFLSPRLRKRTPRVAEGAHTWQNWTTSSPETPLSTRPMTTAQGTKAQRLPQAAPASPSAAHGHDSSR